MLDLLCFIRILQRIKKIKKSGCLNSVVYVRIQLVLDSLDTMTAI